MAGYKRLTVLFFLIWIISPFYSYGTFIAERKDLPKYSRSKNVVMIASTGRSGSTMLTRQIQQYASHYKILKTHLLPPDSKFKGKILFIFSNPNQATESALYMTLHTRGFGRRHFYHVETADRSWLQKIGNAHHQTEEDNLLSYDALGIYEHLKVWLHTGTKPSSLDDAQILAVKYESLWDEETVQAMRDFLHLPDFQLPPRIPRGYNNKELFRREKTFRKLYNLGTEENPRYAAYDDATLVWEQAPSFQYLKIRKAH